MPARLASTYRANRVRVKNAPKPVREPDGHYISRAAARHTVARQQNNRWDGKSDPATRAAVAAYYAALENTTVQAA